MPKPRTYLIFALVAVLLVGRNFSSGEEESGGVVSVASADVLLSRVDPEVRRAFETQAAGLRSLPARIFVQQGRYRPYERHGNRDREMMEQLTTARYPDEDLMGLLEHADPKVRALALLALFDKEDPAHLPVIARMTNDTAETFPGKQTVGDIASEMLRVYMEPVNYMDGPAGSDVCAGFDQYWAHRRDKGLIANWILVRMRRTDSDDGFLTLRGDIAGLPEPQRWWYQLFTGTRNYWEKWGGGRYYSHDEVMQAAKNLGPEELGSLISRNLTLDDPDLTQYTPFPGCNDIDPFTLPYKERFYASPENITPLHHYYAYAGEHMRRFVTEHATELFRPEDWEVFYNAPDRPRRADLTVAAARLNPAQSGQIIRQALAQSVNTDTYNKHMDNILYQTLWELNGPEEREFMLDWFYNNTDRILEDRFLAYLCKADERAALALIKEIVLDPRFEQLNYDHVIHLDAEYIWNWTAEKVPWKNYQDVSGNTVAHPDYVQGLRAGVATWRVGRQRR